MDPLRPALRTDMTGHGILLLYLAASVPALLAGLWAAGFHGLSEPDVSWISGLTAGIALGLPRMGLAVAVSVAWALVFSRVRERPLDPGWLYLPWIFVLLLPPATPLPLVVIGLSFGLLFGCHAFGGTGRYIVNPALLGLVFLFMAYPEVMDNHWVTGSATASTWSVLADGGPGTLVMSGAHWRELALGVEVSAIGAPSALLCLAGLVYLVLKRVAPWRAPAGALAGILVTAWLIGTPGWHVMPVVGNFAVALAFVASDPTTTPRSRAGQWSLGLLFGALTVILRTLNPEHPEGSLQALLLAMLATPVIDHWAARRTGATKVQ